MKRAYLRLLLVFLSFAMLLAGCRGREGSSGMLSPGAQSPVLSIPMPALPQALPDQADTLSSAAQEAVFPQADAAYIRFSQSGVETNAEAVTVSGAQVTLTQPGAYEITGEASGGQIVVDLAEGVGDVHIQLSGVQLRSDDGPALYVKSAGRVILTLKAGTENELSDAESFSDAYKKANACLYSEAPLTLNGTGALFVTGHCKHGISVKDAFVVTDASLTVSAKDDGVKGRDGVAASNAALDITAGGDGLSSSKAQSALGGQIVLADCRSTLFTTGDGAQAETGVYIAGGAVNVKAGGGAAQALFEGSAKGIKSGGDLVLTDAEITADCADDALHAAGSVFLSDVRAALYSGDDGIHADGAVALFSGEVRIEKSNEGVEGLCVDILGGALLIRAANDGINASVSGGKDTDGEDAGSAAENASAPVYVRIAGGTVSIDAAGDGIDSNGDLLVTGGTTLICGPTDNQNGALDFDRTAAITGGMLAALGWPGEAKSFSPEVDGQAFLTENISAREAGERLTLCAADGTVLLSCAPEKAFAHAVLSAPGMDWGDTVSLFRGGSVNGDGLLVAGGRLTDGEKLGSYTLSGKRARP